MGVLNSIELEGVSQHGWKEAAEEALQEAAKTIRHIRRLDILGTSAAALDAEIIEYRARVRLSFETETRR